MQTLDSIIPKFDKSLSIIVIGCGGIVNDAHLPAYKMANYEVDGLFDVDLEKAKALAKTHNIKKYFSTKEEVLQTWKEQIVFDVAVPANLIDSVLEWLPDNSAVLIQKPLGEDLAHAKKLVALCKKKKLRAAVNFQLRSAPNMIKVREMLERGELGEIRDIEVRVSTKTPWDLWPFLYDIPRMEILYHSIHYVDLIRSYCGTPKKVYAKTVGSPEMKRIKNCRTTIIMDYGNEVRANVATNHLHGFGSEHAESYFKLEGTKGCVIANLGVNLDYPKGKPDYLHHYDLNHVDRGWQSITIAGNWFPHAFIGSMGTLLKAEDGQIEHPPTRVEDALETMAVLEAAYKSSAEGGVTPKL